MKKVLLGLFIIILSSTCHAENKSILGIDYLKVTENKIIAEAMLEMEPALIEYYKKGEWVKTTKKIRIYALRGIASVLGIDEVSKNTYEVISEVAPKTPLKFLKLDKKKYPNLWKFGNIMRLSKETKKSLWLYKALHGKDYYEDHPKN
ncbi:MAG: hypothetical protein QM484_01010 [Woeseiaceae bacterium]